MPDVSDSRLPRQIAQLTGTFEQLLLGRAPTSITVVAERDWLVMSVHEQLASVERHYAREPEGARRVRQYHRHLFDESLAALVSHVHRGTGVHLRGGIVHVDTATGSILKTFTTHPRVDLFLLGRGLPALGVPVNAHHRVDGVAHGINGQPFASGVGAARTDVSFGGIRNPEEVNHVGADEEES